MNMTKDTCLHMNIIVALLQKHVHVIETLSYIYTYTSDIALHIHILVTLPYIYIY